MPSPFISHPTMALPISQYLTRKEVIQCMCVSREWESLFTPCLWSDVSLEEVVPSLNTSRRTNTSQITQQKSLILGHGHLIRRLSISTSTLSGRLDKAAAYALKECRNIEILRLNQLDKGRTTRPRNKNNAFVWSVMRDLVLANRRLHRIDMGFMGTSFSPGFLPAVARLPMLHTFEATMGTINCAELHMLLRLPEATGAEPGLHTLTLTFANLLQTAKLVGTGAYGQYPALTHLTLRAITAADWNQQCALICRFPNLVYIDWVYSGADTEPAGNISRDLAKRVFVKCPRIKTFVFSYGAEISLEGGSYVSRMLDHEMVAIVQALPKDLEVLRLDNTSFGHLSFCTLRTRPFYATMLRELRLDNTFVTGVMALDCLETCAGLTKFVAPSIAADELMKRAGMDDKTKPWPCRRQLQYLHAHFSGMIPVRPPCPHATPTDHEKHRTALRQHKIVFSKLAELTWLDKLWLGVPGRLEWYDGEESDDEVTIRMNDAEGEVMLNLTTGLDTLASLKRLRTLVIIGLGQKITMGDVQWMREHWPFLTEIYGKMHPSMKQHRKLFKAATGSAFVSLLKK